MIFSNGWSMSFIILATILIVYFSYGAFKLYKKYNDKKIIYWLCCRILIVVLLFFSISGLSIIRKPRDTATIFLVDTSLSMEKYKPKVQEYINKQIKMKKKNDSFAIMSFGKDTMVETGFTEKSDEIILSTKPNPYFTNIQSGVENALNNFKKNANKRIVLITDGKQNDGDVNSISQKIIQDKVKVIVYKINDSVKDVQLTSIQTQQVAHRNSKIPVRINVDSNYQGDAFINIFSNNKLKIKNKILVKKGKNNFEYELPINDYGKISLKGEINSALDENYLNNVATSYINITNEPLVLVLGSSKDTKNINALFKSSGIKYETYTPDKVPDSMEFLSRFSEIVFANISHDEISSQLEKNTERCVSEMGCGLVVIGGNKSFALGNYENTKFEKMLPVECKMKDNKKQPNMGIVIAVDCSGSMEDESGGIKKIELAKEAAIRSIDTLQDTDYVGVAAFSDTVEWIVPYTKADDKENIKSKIGKLTSKGGTLIAPSIDKSINVLKSSNVKIKHIILLTDGQGEKEGFEKYQQQMKKIGITMSTVAVGKDADNSVLNSFSAITGGRSYMTQDFNSVPKIFTQETYMASKRYLNNDSFTPIQLRETEYFKNIHMPKLYGYTGTGLKSGAELILKTSKDDPLLVSSNYGMGKVIVWTSDLNGQWSRDFIKWNAFKSQFSRLFGWGILDKENSNMQIQFSKKGSKINVNVSTLDKKKQDVSIVITGPEGYKANKNFNLLSQGLYNASFDIETPGEYVVTVKEKQGNIFVDTLTKSISIDYSPEYNIDNGEGENNLTMLIDTVDGELTNLNKNIFESNIIKNYSYINAENIIISICLILFVLDVAIRLLKGRK